jgi:hypothetical protein
MATTGNDLDWAGAADAQEKSLVGRVGDLKVRNEGGMISFIKMIVRALLNQYLLET